MAEQEQGDHFEHTYIQQLCEDTGCSPEDLPEIGRSGERGSRISVLAARHEDDDDEYYIARH